MRSLIVTPKTLDLTLRSSNEISFETLAFLMPDSFYPVWKAFLSERIKNNFIPIITILNGRAI